MYREKIDVVIAYVNPNDKKWQKQYSEYKKEGSEIYKENRFRDTSFLKYVMRSIDKYMKFINRVHLVVAYESQVPEWVNKESVNIVLHRDFIPEEYLPTFNCNTIETFMHFIPDLAENFIYFNDDMIINRGCGPEDFFYKNACNVVSIKTKRKIGDNTWYNCQFNGCKIINKLLDIEEDENLWHIFPHTVTPFKKSLCNEVYNILKNDIHSRITRFRERNNLNQHFYAYYMECVGGVNDKKISVNYINIDRYHENFIKQSYTQTICINDIVIKDVENLINNYNKALTDLNIKFNEISKYENGFRQDMRDKNDIDGVLVYVNPDDSEWYERYKHYLSLETNKSEKSISDDRIRDMFTIKGVLRSIDEHMPFIKRMHLVVQSESQVPDFINREAVNVVLHEDFIPSEFLPTFNSHTIEMFLHRIPNLANRYIVFNDDMLIMKDIHENDVFDGGVPRDFFCKYETEKIAYHYNNNERFYEKYPNVQLHPHINNNIFAHECNNTKYDAQYYYRPNHGFVSFNKHFVEYIYNKHIDTIHKSCTRFRDDINLYYYSYRLCNWLKYKRHSLLTTKFLTFNSSPGVLIKTLTENEHDCVAINDDGLNEKLENDYRIVLNDYIYSIFNKKSKYEKDINVAVCAVSKDRSNNDLKKWVKHYKQLGIKNIIFFDNNTKNNDQYHTLKQYIDEGFVIYNDYKDNNDRVLISAYKYCYKNYSDNYGWIVFLDTDEYMRLCGVKIYDYLSDNKFAEYNVIQLNRVSFLDVASIKKGISNKVRSIIRANINRMTFNNSYTNIYEFLEYCPNPSNKEIRVCDYNGHIVDSFCEKKYEGEKYFIAHEFCKSFNDLLIKLKNGFLKENPFNRICLSKIEEELLFYFTTCNIDITNEHIDRINCIFPNFNITKESIMKTIHTVENSDIDYVFPYVDNNDKEWQTEYIKYKKMLYPNAEESILFGDARYNNFDLLKYKFRSIEKNMPWIRKIHMIVSSPSQVPKWLDTEKVHIVYHKDIIPENFLPVFNSSAIEMFLGNIEGLSEKFIYGNDDFYAIKPCMPYMFFRGNKSLVYLKERRTQADNPLDAASIHFHKNDIKLALFDIKHNLTHLYNPGHGDKPLLKSTCLYFLSEHKSKLYDSVTKFREDNNYNQYLYEIYDISHGKGISYKQPCKPFFLRDDIGVIQNMINAIKSDKYYCISIDFNNGIDKNLVEVVDSVLHKYFDKKSVYEK